jgi:hypothetical protein
LFANKDSVTGADFVAVLTVADAACNFVVCPATFLFRVMSPFPSVVLAQLNVNFIV